MPGDSVATLQMCCHMQKRKWFLYWAYKSRPDTCCGSSCPWFHPIRAWKYICLNVPPVPNSINFSSPYPLQLSDAASVTLLPKLHGRHKSEVTASTGSCLGQGLVEGLCLQLLPLSFLWPDFSKSLLDLGKNPGCLFAVPTWDLKYMVEIWPKYFF